MSNGLAIRAYPDGYQPEVKAVSVSREALIKTRTQLIGRVRGYARARLGRVLRATPESLPKRVRQALLDDPEGLPAHLERVLVALETVSEQMPRPIRSSARLQKPTSE